MRQEPCVVVLPVRWHTDACVIEVRGGCRVQRERSPESNQNEDGRNYLRSYSCERQKKQEHVSQSDLGQRVFKREIGLLMANGSQQDSQQNEHKAPPDRMTEQFPETLPLSGPARNRKRHSRPDQK